ncbi:MAG: hypothetical protein KOO69_01365 [Victivallales bacterium]|nr:hypothetical protein [Victivallales bacterium]
MLKKNVLLTMILVGLCYTFFFYSNTAFCIELPKDIDWEQWRIRRDSSDTKRPAQRQAIDYHKMALKKAYELNKKGNQAYKTENWKEAVSYYQNALSKSPNDKVIRQNLINAKNALTKAQNALAKEYVQKKDASKLNKQGNQAYRSKNWKKAINYYKSALIKSPYDRVIKKNLIYAQKALAKEYTQKKDASKLNKQGNQAYWSKNWEKAIDYYKKASRKSPSNKVFRQNLTTAQNALSKQRQREKLVAEKRRKLKKRQDKALKIMKRFATASAEVNLAISTNADSDEALEQQNSSFIEILNTDVIAPKEKRKHKLRLSLINKNAVPPLDMSTQASASIRESFFTENLSMDQYVGSNLRGLGKAFRLFKEVREEAESQGVSKAIDLLIGTIRNPRIATAMKGGKVVSNKAFDALNKFMEAAMKAVGGHHDSKQFWKECSPVLMQKEKKSKTWTYWRQK